MSIYSVTGGLWDPVDLIQEDRDEREKSRAEVWGER